MVVLHSLPPDTGSLVRLRGPLELRCLLDSTDESQRSEVVSRAFRRLRSQVESTSCVFALCDGPVFLWPNGDCTVSAPEGLTASSQWEELLPWAQTDQQLSSGKKTGKKKSKKSAAVSVINLQLLMEVTHSLTLPAPVLSTTVQKSHFLSTTLSMDCAVTVSCSHSVREVCGLLLEALTVQLGQMEKVTLQHLKGTSLQVPEAFHFLLPEARGLTTVVYPAGVPETGLEAQRKELHQRFHLPDDWPFFRRANAFHFPGEAFRDGYLRNPHLVLAPPALEDADVSLVQGVYSYHHYLQDGLEDQGWGCAYRSLQTICSWFLQQGLVERPVPSHREIQEALVAVGDKPASFVGSRQWIGSIEVQVVLDQLLGVASKILFVSQGSELVSRGRELSNHFLSEGTPVMIGGGVLAHTILGVSWSQITGQIRFLILDPHFTGAEDLQLITEKGWCGWKGPEFWDQTAYYNLCLPQRPKII